MSGDVWLFSSSIFSFFLDEEIQNRMEKKAWAPLIQRKSWPCFFFLVLAARQNAFEQVRKRRETGKATAFVGRTTF